MNHSVVTPWTTVENLVEKLEIGDLIEIIKCSTMGIPIRNHWAVYIGYKDGMHIVGQLSNRKNENRAIISLINLFSGSSCNGKGASIRISNLFNVCGGYQCRINNSMDKDCEPLPSMLIYHRVISAVNDYGYPPHPIYCETFAKWARYDLSICEQENVGKALVIGSGIFSFKNILLIALVTTVLGYFRTSGIGIKRIRFINKIFHCRL
uniref:LRAT domain-containing protein n=1 Tax=Strongyloides papillosus TaxID=174720 RepID=A0A0N5BI17_STREA